MDETEKELSSIDLEILILSLMAFWGDGRLDKQEFYFIKDYYGTSDPNNDREKTSFSGFSDLEDSDLSIKEYLVWIFDLIHEFREQKKNEDKNMEEVEEDLLVDLTSRLNKKYVSEKIGKRVNDRRDKFPNNFRIAVRKILQFNKLTKREKILAKIFRKTFAFKTLIRKRLDQSFIAFLILISSTLFFSDFLTFLTLLILFFGVYSILYFLNFIINRVLGV